MLEDWVVADLGHSEIEEARDGRVTNDPVDGLQHMPLHLSEHVIVVEGAAHGLELPNRGHALLLVTVLGGNEQRGASDQLIVALVDNTAGAVAIEEVYRQVQGLRK